MAIITEEMKTFIDTHQAFVATATRDGIPSVAPKGSTKALDEENLIFAEAAGKRTYDNIKRNPKVAILVSDAEQMKCLRFSGTAELLIEGPVFDEMAGAMKKKGLPIPQAVVKVKVEEIYDCGSPGFGKRID